MIMESVLSTFKRFGLYDIVRNTFEHVNRLKNNKSRLPYLLLFMNIKKNI